MTHRVAGDPCFPPARHALFAALATAVDLMTQCGSGALYAGRQVSHVSEPGQLCAVIIAGTRARLIAKHSLDQRFLFRRRAA